MTWFVLVPGACHGGWWFEPLAAELRAAGHTADAVTLAGMDPDASVLPTGINLESHVTQLLDVVNGRDDDVVLVGHSYAGSVISAVADRIPSRVGGLVYLDAFVPADGDSCWSMTNDEQRDWYISGSARTGLAVDPLPFFDARARPQPLGTLLQRTTVSGAYLSVPNLTYVLAADRGWMAHSPFVAIADRLRVDPKWNVVDLDSTHNFLAKGTHDIRDLLLN